MSEPARFEIVDGPDKPALLWAVAYPDRQEVTFKLSDGSIAVRLDKIDEAAEGLVFQLAGHVSGGEHDGRPVSGTYSVPGRTGRLTLG